MLRILLASFLYTFSCVLEKNRGGNFVFFSFSRFKGVKQILTHIAGSIYLQLTVSLVKKKAVFYLVCKSHHKRQPIGLFYIRR